MKSKFSQGVRLFFINPGLFLKYFRKFFIETVLFPLENLNNVPDRFQKKIGGVLFEMDFSVFPKEHKFQKEMRYGFYEIATVEYMKKALKPGDIFIDAGANVGYLTAVGASLVGKEGQVHSFEPLPQIFPFLERLKSLNPGFNIFLNNCALGDKDGIARIGFFGYQHSGGSSMVIEAVKANSIEKVIEARVMRLDEYIKERKLDGIALIKIDVEGYEFRVLKGLSGYFASTSKRPPIICETSPTAYSFIGLNVEGLIDYMRSFGYEAYDIYNPKIKIDLTKAEDGINVVWKAKT